MEKKTTTLRNYMTSIFLPLSTPKGLLTTMITWFTAYWAPIGAIVTVVFIFVFADFITGIWAAKKKGIKITSPYDAQLSYQTIVLHDNYCAGFLPAKGDYQVLMV